MSSCFVLLVDVYYCLFECCLFSFSVDSVASFGECLVGGCLLGFTVLFAIGVVIMLCLRLRLSFPSDGCLFNCVYSLWGVVLFLLALLGFIVFTVCCGFLFVWWLIVCVAVFVLIEFACLLFVIVNFVLVVVC